MAGFSKGGAQDPAAAAPYPNPQQAQMPSQGQPPPWHGQWQQHMNDWRQHMGGQPPMHTGPMPPPSPSVPPMSVDPAAPTAPAYPGAPEQNRNIALALMGRA